MKTLRSWLGDRGGAAAVETAIVAPFLFTAVIGMFDLGVYLFRWNQAVEATRVGARTASVSDPVSSDLSAMTGLETGVQPGDPVGAYSRACAGTACSGGTFSATAFNRIFFGPGSTTCTDATTRESVGMCDAFKELGRAQVTVTYRNSGVDSAGVEGALRPLITVSVSGAPSGVTLLDWLAPGMAVLPDAATTTVAEDLRSDA